MLVAAAGALVEFEAERTDLASGTARQVVVGADPHDDRLAIVATLFADLTDGQRLVASRYAMGAGLWRRGNGAIWKQYVGPPPLPEDPDERDRFLAEYRVRRRDVQDAINQLLGRDPEQHRPPRLAWETLIERLAQEGIEVSEQELLELPFRFELSVGLEAQLDAER